MELSKVSRYPIRFYYFDQIKRPLFAIVYVGVVNWVTNVRVVVCIAEHARAHAE